MFLVYVFFKSHTSLPHSSADEWFIIFPKIFKKFFSWFLVTSQDNAKTSCGAFASSTRDKHMDIFTPRLISRCTCSYSCNEPRWHHPPHDRIKTRETLVTLNEKRATEWKKSKKKGGGKWEEKDESCRQNEKGVEEEEWKTEERRERKRNRGRLRGKKRSLTKQDEPVMKQQ